MNQSTIINLDLPLFKSEIKKMKRKQMIHAIKKPIFYLTISTFKTTNTLYFICTSNEPPNVMVMEAVLAQDRPQFWVTYTTEPLRRKVM